MGIESAVIQYLLTQTTVTALTSTRVYPNAAPSNLVKPFVTLRLISDTPVSNLTGNVGVTTARIETMIWSQTFTDLDTVGDAIRAALQNYTGTIGSLTIVWALLENVGADAPVEPVDGSANFWYARPLEFMIRYRNAITLSVP